MTNTKKFSRNIEDFQCEHCGFEVTGDGYTNHCPECLWSKHVDVNPGDRSNDCQGLMKPVEIEGVAGESVIVHHCVGCNFLKRNKVQQQDNQESVLRVARGEGD